MLQKACCCYSLRHGTVVIGVGFLIASGIALLMEVALVVEWDDIQARHQNWDNHHGIHHQIMNFFIMSRTYKGRLLVLVSGKVW